MCFQRVRPLLLPHRCAPRRERGLLFHLRAHPRLAPALQSHSDDLVASRPRNHLENRHETTVFHVRFVPAMRRRTLFFSLGFFPSLSACREHSEGLVCDASTRSTPPVQTWVSGGLQLTFRNTSATLTRSSSSFGGSELRCPARRIRRMLRAVDGHGPECQLQVCQQLQEPVGANVMSDVQGRLLLSDVK